MDYLKQRLHGSGRWEARIMPTLANPRHSSYIACRGKLDDDHMFLTARVRRLEKRLTAAGYVHSLIPLIETGIWVMQVENPTGRAHANRVLLSCLLREVGLVRLPNDWID